MNGTTRAEEVALNRQDEEKRFEATKGDKKPRCASGAGYLWQSDSSWPIRGRDLQSSGETPRWMATGGYRYLARATA